MDPKTILFLCDDNAARSLMAEAFVNSAARSRFRAFSAGFNPAASADADALEVIAQVGIRARGLHPKSWRKFTAPDGPAFDYAIHIGDTERPEITELKTKTKVTHWPISDRSIEAALGASRRAELLDLFAEIRQMAEATLLRPSTQLKRALNREDRSRLSSCTP
ncbi:arsenate reductase [Rhodoligotrophos appendicifer]|uniref:arsenate reductase/protein-tyrosine-phosphatase family protein n=1 Tax=Rhodoligotrophos appendicifer TaxID=987056 RepID=UPI00117D2CB0|nr:hypothetical protein [Rhodoligotrophos appendicifer]